MHVYFKNLKQSTAGGKEDKPKVLSSEYLRQLTFDSPPKIAQPE